MSDDMTQQWNDKGEWLEAIELEDIPADVVKSISARLRELSSALPPARYVTFPHHPNPTIAKWIGEARKRTKRDFDGEWLSSDMTQEESSLEMNTPGYVSFTQESVPFTEKDYERLRRALDAGLASEGGPEWASLSPVPGFYPDAFPYYPNCRTCERPLQELVARGTMLVFYGGRSYCSDACATEAMDTITIDWEKNGNTS